MVKALIIIDMIKGNTLNIYNPKEIISNQVKLIEEFNKHKLPIIVVTGKSNSEKNPVMLKLWGDEFADEPEKKELIQEVTKSKYSIKIEKSEYSAFFQTELEQYCKNNNIDEIYFTGVYSGVCVYFSAVDAAYRRIQPYLVTDASTTEKQEWHERNCERFKTVIGPLITTQKLIDSLK
ncbi:cysteine hydrolase [Candidatus Woesearchaeota archaeon]|nr:cysteine hydrolase [Candidatus Woesearchaeota archaeon]